MVKEYLAENTNFSITKESITKEDLPTITICILTRKEKREKGKEHKSIKYGQDFTIQTMKTWAEPWFNPNTTMITLSEGINDYEFFEQKRQIKLEEMRVFSFGYLIRNCVKLQFTISALIYGQSIQHGVSFDVGMFTITLSETMTKNIQEATVYTTSENNSYGAVLKRWYDGKVEPIQLPIGKYTAITVTKMKRHEYLERKCSPTSFYGCIGEKMKQQEACQINGTICSPITIPTDKMPICPTTNPQFCDEAIVQAASECVGLIPCITEEYSLWANDLWSSKESSTEDLFRQYLFDKLVKQLMEAQQRKYYFWIQLTSDKNMPHGYYSDKVQKFVHKEYLVWTGISMVGNIGGQLGLWVGFSFTGLVAGILSLWYCVQRQISSNKHLGTGIERIG